ALRACVTDWDGTLRPGFMVADWLSFLSKELGVAASYHKQFLRLSKDYRSGKIRYEKFASEAVATYGQAIHGIKCTDIDAASEAFAKDDVRNLFPFTVDLLNKISSAG